MKKMYQGFILEETETIFYIKFDQTPKPEIKECLKSKGFKSKDCRNWFTKRDEKGISNIQKVLLRIIGNVL